ncbi:MAG: hypothetical protein M3367_02850 [Acidobacteriota bacterium]|nr:hypothetical protein [Acidobacteriota bacterium]
MAIRETAAAISAFVFKFAQLEDDGAAMAIDGQTKSQAIVAAEHLRILSEARSKGGKANKKFASDKERYAFHNARRRAARARTKADKLKITD